MRAILLSTVKFFWRMKILIVTFYVHRDNPIRGLGIHRSLLFMSLTTFHRIKPCSSPFSRDLGGRISGDTNIATFSSDDLEFFWRFQIFSITFSKKLNIFNLLSTLKQTLGSLCHFNLPRVFLAWEIRTLQSPLLSDNREPQEWMTLL